MFVFVDGGLATRCALNLRTFALSANCMEYLTPTSMGWHFLGLQVVLFLACLPWLALRIFIHLLALLLQTALSSLMLKLRVWGSGLRTLWLVSGLRS